MPPAKKTLIKNFTLKQVYCPKHRRKYTAFSLTEQEEISQMNIIEKSTPEGFEEIGRCLRPLEMQAVPKGVDKRKQRHWSYFSE